MADLFKTCGACGRPSTDPPCSDTQGHDPAYRNAGASHIPEQVDAKVDALALMLINELRTDSSLAEWFRANRPQLTPEQVRRDRWLRRRDRWVRRVQSFLPRVHLGPCDHRDCY